VKLRNKQRFISLTIIGIVVIVLLLISWTNLYVNPYAFYGFNQKKTAILNARHAKYTELKSLNSKPEIFVFGSSNSMRFLPKSLSAHTGLDAYNYGVFYATAEDYYCIPKALYEIDRLKPKLMIFCLDVFSFSIDNAAYDEVFVGARNRLSYDENLAKHLPDFSSTRLFWFRLKTSLTLKQTKESVTAILDGDIHETSEMQKLKNAFSTGGVRKNYANFEGNNITELAESGQYNVSNYIRQKDQFFFNQRNGYKGIISVLGNYDFNGLSPRRLELFEKNIQFLQSKNCKVIINLMPVQPYFKTLLVAKTDHEQNILDLLSFCQHLEKTYPNIILLKDNSDITNFNGKSEHFFDSYHPTSVNSDLMISSFHLDTLII